MGRNKRNKLRVARQRHCSGSQRRRSHRHALRSTFFVYYLFQFIILTYRTSLFYFHSLLVAAAIEYPSKRFRKCIHPTFNPIPACQCAMQLYCVVTAEGAHGAINQRTDNRTGLDEYFFDIFPRVCTAATTALTKTATTKKMMRTKHEENEMNVKK